MKTLKTMALAFAFVASGLVFAGAGPVEKMKPETIGQTVSDLLSSPDVKLTSDQVAFVEFYVNNENEIVLVSVDTQNISLKRFIKSRLNYEKVSPDLVKTKNEFKMLLKFTESN